MSYELLLFVHVICAIVWVGAVIYAQAVAWFLLKTEDSAAVLAFVRSSQGAAKLIGPAVLLLLAAGIALVEKLGLSYTTPWILIGLCGYALSIGVGGVYASREIKRVEELVSAGEAEPAAVRAGLRRGWTAARVDMAILLGVVWAMTWKPGA